MPSLPKSTSPWALQAQETERPSPTETVEWCDAPYAASSRGWCNSSDRSGSRSWSRRCRFPESPGSRCFLPEPSSSRHHSIHPETPGWALFPRLLLIHRCQRVWTLLRQRGLLVIRTRQEFSQNLEELPSQSNLALSLCPQWPCPWEESGRTTKASWHLLHTPFEQAVSIQRNEGESRVERAWTSSVSKHCGRWLLGFRLEWTLSPLPSGPSSSNDDIVWSSWAVHD